MNDEQLDRLIDAFEVFALGVNKIGEACKSLSLYVWLPIYIVIFVLLFGSLTALFFWVF